MTNDDLSNELTSQLLAAVLGGQSTGADQAAGAGQVAGTAVEAWLTEPRVFRPSRGPHFMPLNLAG